MKEYISASPYFFRRIKIFMLLLVCFLLLLAWIFPAPLQEPAQESQVPNPVKAAWFLLWLQELLSYSKQLVYLVLAVGAFFLFLPFISRNESERADWFPRDQVWVNLAVVITFWGIVLLTLVAWLCRGVNWNFIWPL